MCNKSAMWEQLEVCSRRRLQAVKPNGMKTVTFHMARFTAEKSKMNPQFSGMLLDDGAPYSGIRIRELNLLSPFLRTNWNVLLKPFPESLCGYSFWKYCTLNHATSSKCMLGSIFIVGCLCDGSIINIRHIIIDSSSQWVVRRNVTSECDIVHLNGNYLKLPNNLKIPTKDVHMHSFLPSHLFMTNTPNSSPSFQVKIFCTTADIQETASDRAWSDAKKIVDKVRKHVCGHAKLRDMQTLLERNNLWNHEIETYLNRIVNSCSNCARCFEPNQAWKVSLSSPTIFFNDVACIDHFHVGNMRICRIMDAATHYSVGAAVPYTGMESAINALDSH